MVHSKIGGVRSETIRGIVEFTEDGKPILLYFSRKSISNSVNESRKYKNLVIFKILIRKKAVVRDFETMDEFSAMLDFDLRLQITDLNQKRTRSISTKLPRKQVTYFDASPQDQDILCFFDRGLEITEICKVTGWSKNYVYRVLKNPCRGEPFILRCLLFSWRLHRVRRHS